MYSIIFLLCFIGFYCVYNTSKKAKLSKDGKIEIWLQANTSKANYIGIILILISVVLFSTYAGIGIGLFSSALMLMAVSSVIIAFAPLYYFDLKRVTIIVLISFILELLIF